MMCLLFFILLCLIKSIDCQFPNAIDAKSDITPAPIIDILLSSTPISAKTEAVDRTQSITSITMTTTQSITSADREPDRTTLSISQTTDQQSPDTDTTDQTIQSNAADQSAIDQPSKRSDNTSGPVDNPGKSNQAPRSVAIKPASPAQQADGAALSRAIINEVISALQFNAGPSTGFGANRMPDGSNPMSTDQSNQINRLFPTGDSSGVNAMDPSMDALSPLRQLLPTLSKLSTPIARLIVNKGNPTVEDIDQILRALPDLAVMLASAGITGTGGIGFAKSDDSNLTDLSTWNQQQISKLIDGSAPLPPLNTISTDQVRLILGNGTIPGWRSDQIQALRERYMQDMVNRTIVSLQSIPQSAFGSAPLIGNFYANISTSQSITINNESIDNVRKGLRELDWSKLPPDVFASLIQGKTPDWSKVSPSDLQSIINKTMLNNINDTDQSNQSIVTNADQSNRSISNDTSTLNGTSPDRSPINIIDGPQSGLPVSPGLAPTINIGLRSQTTSTTIPITDIDAYKGESKDRTGLYVAIGMSIFGALTIIATVFLCWRHYQRKRRQEDEEESARYSNFGPPSASSNTKTNSTNASVVNEERMERDNRFNSQVEAGIGRAGNQIGQYWSVP